VTLPDVIRKPVPQEFDELFREHYQFVFRTAYGITGSSEDAEDVLQTIFLRLLRRELPPDLKTNPKGYLYRAAVNVALNTIRRRKRHILTDAAERFEAPPDASESHNLEDLHKRLYAAIAELEPEGAELMILRHVHDYSDAQIAKLLGKSRGMVAVRLYRLRARLKKIMNGEKS
jgi:RNA polymerase sigma-70 factor (ECF subfamily)